MAGKVVAALSRRASLLALGAVGLASVGQADRMSARKRKKGRKKCTSPSAPVDPVESCTETCRACEACYTRAEGSMLCGHNVGFGISCNSPCTSDKDCAGTNQPYCVSAIEERATGRNLLLCPGREPPVCASVVACVT